MRPALHPPCLRCSPVDDCRYAPSSRLATLVHRHHRCDALRAPRTARAGWWILSFWQHFDCLAKSESIFEWGRVKSAAPPVIVAIRREEVLQGVGLGTVQVLALDTPKVAREGQSLDAPVLVEDLDLHVLRYRLEQPTTPGCGTVTGGSPRAA